MAENKDYHVSLSMTFNSQTRYIEARIHSADFQETMKTLTPEAKLTITGTGLSLDLRRDDFQKLRATGVMPKALGKVFDAANKKMVETDNARSSFFSKLLESVRYTPGVPLSTARAESKDIPGLKASVQRFDL